MSTLIAERHPSDSLFRADRLPHIWCPGCGIGPAMHAFAQAMVELSLIHI